MEETIKFLNTIFETRIAALNKYFKLSNDSGKKRGNSSEHNNGQKESQKLLSENIDYIPVFNK